RWGEQQGRDPVPPARAGAGHRLEERLEGVLLQRAAEQLLGTRRRPPLRERTRDVARERRVTREAGLEAQRVTVAHHRGVETAAPPRVQRPEYVRRGGVVGRQRPGLLEHAGDGRDLPSA